MLRGVYPEETAEILRFAQDDSERAQHDSTEAQRLAPNRCLPRPVLSACTLLFILGWCLTAFKPMGWNATVGLKFGIGVEESSKNDVNPVRYSAKGNNKRHDPESMGLACFEFNVGVLGWIDC
jgi:hypothetical protein